MYKQYKHKDKVRRLLYLITVIIIGFFISDSYKLCTELTDKEIKSYSSFDNYNYQSINQSMKYINLNLTTGGLIWNLFINTLQIVFLVMFMLILYINELIERWYLKD